MLRERRKWCQPRIHRGLDPIDMGAHFSLHSRVRFLWTWMRATIASNSFANSASSDNSIGCLCIAQKRCQPRSNLGLHPIGMHPARNTNLGLRALRLPFRESALLVPFGGHGRMSLHCLPVPLLLLGGLLLFPSAAAPLCGVANLRPRRMMSIKSAGRDHP